MLWKEILGIIFVNIIFYIKLKKLIQGTFYKKATPQNYFV